MSGASADGADSSLPQLVLPLHATIRALQLKNGLRHGDYQRYRHYTTRRLRRLRKHAKATHHTKGKTFTVKHITLDTLGGPEKLQMEHLLLALLNAERAWAFSMQLKQTASKLNAKHKHHVKKRLRRAALWAQRLQHLATNSHRVAERSVLEVAAYSAWLSATSEAEAQHWTSALTHFNTAHSILAQLAQVGTLEEQDLFSSRAEEVQQSLRFVKYNLGQSSMTDTQELLATLDTTNTAADVPLGLREKLEAVLASSREEQATQLHELTWGHKTLTINSQHVALAVLKVKEASKALETSKEDNKDHLYTQVYDSYDSALRETNKALTALQAMTSGTKVEDHKTQLTALQSYLSYHKLQWMLTRNEALVAQLHSSGEPKAEDLVHVYDALLQNVCEMLALPELEDMDDLLTHTQALESYYRAQRAYHLALFYAAPQRAQLAESLVLLDLCVTLASEAAPLLQAHKTLATHAKEADKLQALAAGGRYRVQALSLLQSLGQQSGASSDVCALSAALGALTLSSAPAPTLPTPLLDRTHLYQAGSAGDGYGLPSLPPALSLLTVKPQLFELAGNHLMDVLPGPSIKHKAGARSPDRRARADQQDGASKGFFGWLRG